MWWNRVATLTEDEMELMPYGFVKKFGTFADQVGRNELESKTDVSKAYKNRWDEVRSMKRLLTNEEKEEIETFKDYNLDNGVNNPDDYDHSGYMMRQPRMELRNKNFNFEQFNAFTLKYEEARSKDELASKEFYKLVKYVRSKKDDENVNGNLIVRDFLKKYKLDLIDIPEEF